MNPVAPRATLSEPARAPRRKTSVLSGAVSLSGAQIVRRGFRSVFLLLGARVLGPEAFGFYVLLFTVNEIFAVLSGSGFGDYITREVSKFPELARQYLVRIIQLHCFYVLVILSIAVPFMHHLKYSASALASAVLLSLTLFPRGLVESSQGIMRSMHRFRLVFWIEFVEGMVLLGVGAILLYEGRGVRGVIWAELASVLAGALVALPSSLRLASEGGRSVFSWLKLIRETFVFNLYPLVSSTYDRVDVIILARLVGTAAVGTYSLGYKGYAALSILPYGLMASLLPSLAKSNWNREDRDSCRITMQRLYVAALFVILVAALLTDKVVRITLGNGYQGTAATLKILVWATIPMFLNYSLNTFLLARKRERVFLWTASVCTVVNVTANLLLIPRYSYLAAAWVTILTELVLFILNIILLRKSLGYILLPKNILSNSIFFVILLAGAEEVARFLSPIVVAAVGMAVFAAYLHATGIFYWSGRRGHNAYAA